MAKYIRKIFILLKIRNLFLVIKQTPSFLLNFLRVLNTPIVHKFINPFTGELIEDKKKNFQTKFIYFLFLKNASFTNQKIRQQGRVKRKITRKLVLKNQLVD